MSWGCAPGVAALRIARMGDGVHGISVSECVCALRDYASAHLRIRATRHQRNQASVQLCVHTTAHLRNNVTMHHRYHAPTQLYNYVNLPTMHAFLHACMHDQIACAHAEIGPALAHRTRQASMQRVACKRACADAGGECMGMCMRGRVHMCKRMHVHGHVYASACAWAGASWGCVCLCCASISCACGLCALP